MTKGFVAEMESAQLSGAKRGRLRFALLWMKRQGKKIRPSRRARNMQHPGTRVAHTSWWVYVTRRIGAASLEAEMGR